MAPLRVPVEIVSRSPRVDAALSLAAGEARDGSLSAALNGLCDRIAELCRAKVASVYVLEAGDELVLRGNHGFAAEALGQVRLHVGQGITGTAVQARLPVTVDDARFADQFAYFPQLAEERYPAFLAVPVVTGDRVRGALVLQREAGPFPEDDALLALLATRPVGAVLETHHPHGAHVLLHGDGNGRGRALGLATVLSRAMPRRDARRAESDELSAAFAMAREEVLQLAERARGALTARSRELEEVCTTVLDARLEERAIEHAAQHVPASIALERIASEVARQLAAHGPAARRAVDVEAFLGAVAHRLANLEPQRLRRGEVMVTVHLSGLHALRGFAQGVTGAICARAREECNGAALLTALGLPVVCGVKQIFESCTQGDRLALDGNTGEVVVNPNAAQAAEYKRT